MEDRMSLRGYQLEAVDAAIGWMRASVDPALIDAATGAGKSHMIAAIADRIHGMTGKRILCLAPSAELVMQNRAKYLATGNPCSTFSASAGAKELRHPVVFGSPLTVKNRISRFKQQGADGYALVIVDECHGITPTLKSIIEEMKTANQNLRVLGLTATPYRLGTGYIFRQWPDGRVNDGERTRDPYFQKCVYRVDARDLIEQRFLTPPVIGSVGADGYDTSGLVANTAGKFDAAQVEQAYHGHGRKTAGIVADVVAQSKDRRGVLLFAATVQHAQEVMASLPPAMSAIVTGTTPKKERDRILARFLAEDVKYLVNVSVLTTGFDAPHVDVVALLRKTESVGLLQQIIGRGLRLSPGKADCLVLDYTTNIEDHCPDGDLFDPEIVAGKEGGGGESMDAKCEWCEYVNKFNRVGPPTVPEPIWIKNDGRDSRRTKKIDVTVDENGYCLDALGMRVETKFGAMPAHFGRRCWGQVRQTGGTYEQCEYRWTSKDCRHCGEHNDITARYCSTCKGELVDPNEKLIGEFRKMKRDPHQRQTDEVASMKVSPGVSRSGNRTIRVDFVTPYRSFSIWLMPDGEYSKARKDYQLFAAETDMGNQTPTTVTYQKEPSGFFRVFAYNRAADVEPEVRLAAE
jgi:DNA repair protein RadD